MLLHGRSRELNLGSQGDEPYLGDQDITFAPDYAVRFITVGCW